MPQRRRPPRAGALSDLPPLRILKQITLLQLAFYTCGTVLILFTALVAGKPFTADLVLSWRSLRGDTTVGWTLGLCWMLNSFLRYAKGLHESTSGGALHMIRITCSHLFFAVSYFYFYSSRVQNLSSISP